MADKKADSLEKKLDDIVKQTNLAVFGSDGTLESESDLMKSIIRGTMRNTSAKYGKKTQGNVVDYFNQLNFTSAFVDAFKDPADKSKKNDKDPEKTFKKYMSEQDIGDINGILAGETSRLINYSNYTAIYNHIPECAQALNTYKDNIMSPDDFTKLIFNISYENEINKNIKKKVEEQLDDIVEKYELDILAEEIIEGSLLYGDQFLAILSLEDELDMMLTDPSINNKKETSGNKILKEDKILIDANSYDLIIDPIDIPKSKFLTEAVIDALHLTDEKEKEKINEDVTVKLLAEIANKNIQIVSKKELLLERLSAEQDKIKFQRFSDLPKLGQKDKTDKKTRDDSKPMYINGSTLKLLDPSKVVELRIDNTTYGYYYLQDGVQSNIPNAGYLGPSTGREVMSPTNIGTNLVTTNNSKFTPSTNGFSTLGVSDAKVNLISKIFLDVISKKVDKDFIRHNKGFKDFIYNLVKQDYILKKEIRLTYFSPAEVISFKVPAVYRNIVFMAKLYMAQLTNTLLIKMGRGHDKRVFYVDTGLDQNYEQAINRVLQDIKTKEFKMDTMGDINTILSLSPGRFDDYYIPTVNGDKSIEIDTLQGMDTDMSNDFLIYLNDRMMSGIGVPTAAIDATKEVDFARTLSMQNGNFLRSVVKYQKRLTEPFNRVVRTLYRNEFKYNDDGESDIANVVDIYDIHIEFPSPATLALTNMMEQIGSAEQAAEFFATTLVPVDPMDQGGDNERTKAALKTEIIKDLLPGSDWDRYIEMLRKIKPDLVKDKVKNAEKIDTNAIEEQY